MRRYDAVIFDTDQTLIDSKRLVGKEFNHTMLTLYDVNKTFTDLRREQYEGISMRKIIEAMLKSIGKTDSQIKTDNLIDRSLATFHEHITDALDALKRSDPKKELEKIICPGVVPLLTKLRENGLYIASYTGATETVNAAFLKATGLEPLLHARSTSNKDEDRIDVLLNAYGKLCKIADRTLHCERTLVIGDSIEDVKVAKKAGMDSMWLCGGRYSIDSLQHAPTYLQHNLEKTDEIVRQILGD
jgi:phosphoglycolate phosphatase-like HAD superfamily hydrolase